MDEEEKYTKLWALPQGYGNPWDKNNPYWNEVADFIMKSLYDRGFQVTDSVLDVGGGNGKFEPWLGLEGGSYTALDIAPNSGADIVADISTSPRGLRLEGLTDKYDWTLAIDMLEHLPTERVRPALANISRHTSHGFIALISTRPDRGGKKIGATLHMTVREPDWWADTLFDYWRTIKILRVVKGEYCIMACH